MAEEVVPWGDLRDYVPHFACPQCGHKETLTATPGRAFVCTNCSWLFHVDKAVWGVGTLSVTLTADREFGKDSHLWKSMPVCQQAGWCLKDAHLKWCPDGRTK